MKTSEIQVGVEYAVTYERCDDVINLRYVSKVVFDDITIHTIKPASPLQPEKRFMKGTETAADGSTREIQVNPREVLMPFAKYVALRNEAEAKQQDEVRQAVASVVASWGDIKLSDIPVDVLMEIARRINQVTE